MDVGLSKLGEREAETAGEALLASGFRFHSLKMQITKFIMIMIINVTHYPSANDNDQADNSIHLVTDEGANNTGSCSTEGRPHQHPCDQVFSSS